MNSKRLFFLLFEAFALFAATTLYVLAIIFNGLAGPGGADGVAVYQSDTGNISDVYFTQITPAGWAFSIWGVIYTWQALWLLYAWTFVIREFFVPNYPRPISVLTYLFFAASCVPNITWILLWGNWLVVAALPFIIIIPITLYLTVAPSLWRTYKVTSKLSETRWGKVDLWLTRILVHNGVAFYATWVSIAWLLNVAIVAEYFGGMAAVDAGTLSLSLLLVEIVVWCVLEHTILYRFARYIQSVYIVLIIALIAVVSDHWNRTNEETRNHHFALGLLIVVVVVQILKIVLTIVFAFVRPVKFPENKKPTKDYNEV
jgi:hypothetical protein